MSERAKDRWLLSVILSLLWACLLSPAFAATRYVNPATGSDSDNGTTAELAWATLTQADSDGVRLERSIGGDVADNRITSTVHYAVRELGATNADNWIKNNRLSGVEGDVVLVGGNGSTEEGNR
jgi:hypothetical protein